MRVLDTALAVTGRWAVTTIADRVAGSRVVHASKAAPELVALTVTVVVDLGKLDTLITVAGLWSGTPSLLVT
jgi:hypothetical protein